MARTETSALQPAPSRAEHRAPHPGRFPGDPVDAVDPGTTRVSGLWPLAFFVVLAYAVSWGWVFPLAAAGDIVEKGDGWPTHLPALVGPALAALVVTAAYRGRLGVRELLARTVRLRMPMRWWAATLSPLAFLGVALAVASLAGRAPSASDFGLASGLPAIGVAAVALISIVLALGEETGWRGFALPLLQRRFSPLAAALLVTPIWAVWHLPFFFTVATYRGFPPAGYVGFVFGIACGSIVLAWLYNGTGGSILACAIWHGVYNLASGTAAGTGIVAGVTSSFVYVQAMLLVALELRARKRGTASILGPRPAALDERFIPGRAERDARARLRKTRRTLRAGADARRFLRADASGSRGKRRSKMTATREDLAASGLTVLVVLTYFATRNGWGVWLVGGSHRWAAGAILVLGMATCTLGSMTSGVQTTILGVLGIIALGLSVLALVTGSLTPLSWLVVDIVALWSGTFHHVWHSPRRPTLA